MVSMKKCAALVLALSGCLGTPARPTDTVSDARADGASDAPSGCAAFGPWKTPHKLDVGPDLGDETGGWLSPDGLDLWYSAPSSPPIHHAHRTDTSTYVFT